MKIGRNDPCPCGSGKKYKYCCLNKPKIIPFNNNGNAETANAKNIDLENTASPPIHNLMGFSTVEDYETALDEYKYFCETVLKMGETAPSFKEYHDIMGAEETFNIFREDRDVVTIEDQLKELYDKGPFKAESAVTVDKHISTVYFRTTPIIMIAQGILEYLVRKGGKIDISWDSEVHLDLDVLVAILYEWIDPDVFIGPGNRSVFEMWFKFVNILLIRKRFIRYSGKTILEITDKGLKLLKGTGIKTVYFSFLLYLTEKFNWFYSSGLKDEVGYLQDLSGIVLFTISYLKEVKEYLKPSEILNEVDKIFPVYDEFRKMEIGKKKTVDIFTEYFLEGYCRLSGFMEWVPDAGYKPTDFFINLFDWQIGVAYD